MKRIRLVCLAAVAASLGVVPAAVGAGDRAVGPAHVVLAGNARIEVLTPSLVRLEYSADGHFENRPSMVAQDRTPTAAYTSSISQGVLTLRTSALVLRYRLAGGHFTAKDLSVKRLGGGWSARPSWPVGSAPASSAPGNLGGWVRALDDQAGPVALHQGLLTRAGWFLLDDSTDALLTARAPGFAVRATQPGYQDGYFFGYGDDYQRALSDLRTLSGPAPLLPRSAFGVWFSRYYAYSAGDYRTLLKTFRRNHVPLDTLSVDTDWKRQASPLAPTLAGAVVGKTKAYSWNGWEWNSALFPHPKKFIAWAHRHGIDVALNIHPSIDSTDPKYAATVARTGPLKVDLSCTVEQIDPVGQCHV
ncbi:MAG TPA: TIM-barrel domain-containing protein, partial [Mycobacteriales bacterium]|nr:TIM-barrel domain-containing protein [Mycobacteriales bacterium]